jgi:uncharacterized damage-inducible protein DinB
MELIDCAARVRERTMRVVACVPPDQVDWTHDESTAIFRTLGDADFELECMTPGGAELRVGKWLRLMIEHEIHHRGQLYLYLSMLDVETPPLYGLTEEQVHERSQPA